MNSSTIKIAARLLLVFAVLGVTAVLATAAPDSTGATVATTYSCGGLDLKVDSRTTYNGALMPGLTWSLKNLVPGVDRFFNFPDIKPGDTGTTTISLHLTKSTAWVCLDFINLKDKDNGNNEPEALADASGAAGGELSKGVEFFAWLDDGDNKFEVGEKPLFGTSTQAAYSVLNGKTYALADYAHGPAWTVGITRYVGITWCAGNLTVNVANAAISCDGAVLGNGVQTDSFSVDAVLRALPSGENPKFLCTTEKKPEEGGGHDSGGGKDDKNKEKDKGGGHSGGSGGKDDNEDDKFDHGNYSWYQKPTSSWGWNVFAKR